MRTVDRRDRVELDRLQPCDRRRDVVARGAAEARRVALVCDTYRRSAATLTTLARSRGRCDACSDCSRSSSPHGLRLRSRSSSSVTTIRPPTPTPSSCSRARRRGSAGYRAGAQGYAPLLLVSRGSKLELERRLCDGDTELEVICFSATSTAARRGSSRGSRTSEPTQPRRGHVAVHVFRARRIFERATTATCTWSAGPDLVADPKVHGHRERQARIRPRSRAAASRAAGRARRTPRLGRAETCASGAYPHPGVGVRHPPPTFIVANRHVVRNLSFATTS